MGRLRTTCQRCEDVATYSCRVTVVPVPRGAGGRFRDVSAHADAVLVARRAVKPVGRPTYRIVAGASAAGPQKLRNTPDGRTNKCGNFPESPLRAGPRATRDLFPEPIPTHPVTDAAPGSADSAPDGTPSPLPYHDRPGPRATDASDGPVVDTRRCNIGFVVGPAQTGSGIPSTGIAGSLVVDRQPHALARGLDLLRHPTDSRVGPRVPITPYGQVSGRS
jgi:hypothetical protein